MNDFLGSDSHEITANLACQFWERRGRLLGSPDIDWFAAEKTLALSQEKSQEIPLFSLTIGPNEEPYA